MWRPCELDYVDLPATLAARERVNPKGTVVWFTDAADYATIECGCLDDNPDGLATKLLDVPLSELRAAQR
jgi:hypothetical protein